MRNGELCLVTLGERGAGEDVDEDYQDRASRTAWEEFRPDEDEEERAPARWAGRPRSRGRGGGRSCGRWNAESVSLRCGGLHSVCSAR